MRYLRLFIGAIALVFLAGCVSLSTVRTMHSLSSFDPLTSDIGNLAFGVQATPDLKAVPEKTKFTVTVRAAGGAPVVTKIALVEIDPSTLALNALPQKRGQTIKLFGFSEEAKKQLKAQQALWRDMKAKGTKNTSVEIGVSPYFCQVQKIDQSRERFTVYIAVDGKGDLMPLIDNMAVKDLMDKSPEKTIPMCDA